MKSPNKKKKKSLMSIKESEGRRQNKEIEELALIDFC